ncbi:MAG: prepilin-type N-terminal cleavage/methylation domain-containing protein [Pseudomonadota bacterium]
MKTLSSKGFTLLELLLVLAIIGLASAFIVPRLNSDTKLYDAQIRELVAILKYNRRMAVVSNQVRHAVLHPFVEADSSNHAAQQVVKKKGHWYSKGVEFIWTTGDSVNEVKNKQVIIDFFPQGGATEGELFLYFAKLKNKIEVDGFTGKVSLMDIDDNAN